VRRALSFSGHAIQATRLLAMNRRIPRPLRSLVLVGALPIPGPFDEALLLLAAGLLCAFYRQPMREAWRQAASSNVQAPEARHGVRSL